MTTCGDPEGPLAVLKKSFISWIYRECKTEDQQGLIVNIN